MKYYLLLFLFSFSFLSTAQKRTLEVIDRGDIEELVISGDEIFWVMVKTSAAAGDEIRITTLAEGEYYNQINLNSQREGSVLFLTSHYPEILQSGYDKLSAHKIFSMELEIQLPAGMEVNIFSNVAIVFMTGNYEEVFIELNSGSCFLHEFRGKAVVNTVDGNIEVKAIDAVFEAESRNGKVELPAPSQSGRLIKLTSINGNIQVE